MKHKHHIIPKHMGGNDLPENLILLTVEEHANAHKELYEKYGLIEDYLAWKGLSGQISKKDILRRIYSENGKVQGPKNKGNPAPNKGIPMSEEQKQKLRKPKTEEHKKNLRKPKSNTDLMGRYERSEEHRKKFSENRKKLLSSPERREKMSLAAKNSRGCCVFCEREMNKANLGRHQAACKKNPIISQQ